MHSSNSPGANPGTWRRAEWACGCATYHRPGEEPVHRANCLALRLDGSGADSGADPASGGNPAENRPGQSIEDYENYDPLEEANWLHDPYEQSIPQDADYDED